MTQESFWYGFGDSSYPIAAGGQERIPCKRNIIIEGYSLACSDTAITSRLLIENQDNRMTAVLPKHWDTSLGANLTMAYNGRLRAFSQADYFDNYTEYPLSPFPHCDSMNLIIEIWNQTAGTVSIVGHVRGRYFG